VQRGGQIIQQFFSFARLPALSVISATSASERLRRFHINRIHRVDNLSSNKPYLPYSRDSRQILDDFIEACEKKGRPKRSRRSAYLGPTEHNSRAPSPLARETIMFPSPAFSFLSLSLSLSRSLKKRKTRIILARQLPA